MHARDIEVIEAAADASLGGNGIGQPSHNDLSGGRIVQFVKEFHAKVWNDHFKPGMGEATFTKLRTFKGVGEQVRDVSGCTMHVVDLERQYGARVGKTPCPICGFESDTKKDGTLQHPRVARGLERVEYFTGGRYQCKRCKNKKQDMKRELSALQQRQGSPNSIYSASFLI